MKYPKDIDKKSWDIMVEYTCYFLTMIFFLAVIGVVLLMIKDVVWFFSINDLLCNRYYDYNLLHEISFYFPPKIEVKPQFSVNFWGFLIWHKVSKMIYYRSS